MCGNHFSSGESFSIPFTPLRGVGMEKWEFTVRLEFQRGKSLEKLLSKLINLGRFVVTQDSFLDGFTR
jgi:hypothetical protein